MNFSLTLFLSCQERGFLHRLSGRERVNLLVLAADYFA